MPDPLRAFDIGPVIELALKMAGSGLEKDRPCARCVASQRRLLEYALGTALTVNGFELVRRVDGFSVADGGKSE